MRCFTPSHVPLNNPKFTPLLDARVCLCVVSQFHASVLIEGKEGSILQTKPNGTCSQMQNCGLVLK